MGDEQLQSPGNGTATKKNAADEAGDDSALESITQHVLRLVEDAEAILLTGWIREQEAHEDDHENISRTGYSGGHRWRGR